MSKEPGNTITSISKNFNYLLLLAEFHPIDLVDNHNSIHFLLDFFYY